VEFRPDAVTDVDRERVTCAVVLNRAGRSDVTFPEQTFGVAIRNGLALAATSLEVRTAITEAWGAPIDPDGK
jgi:hypothetical protein